MGSSFSNSGEKSGQDINLVGINPSAANNSTDTDLNLAANFKVSDAALSKIKELKSLYPKPVSAVMPIIYIVQEEKGFISEAALHWISAEVGLTPAHVMELVTFYTMYRKKPLGKYHIQVCRTLSCGMCGARQLMEYLHNRLGVEPKEVTQDGMFSYEYVECLGSCGTAPMCEINDTFFENLTPEKLSSVLDRIISEKPDLSFSTVNDKLGDGLKDSLKSEVI